MSSIVRDSRGSVVARLGWRFVLRATLLAASVAPVSLVAQTVRGTVTDRAGQPVSGVVVSLLDSTSVVLARALSGDAGDFRLITARTGTMRLRAQRIGFQPTLSPPFALGSGATVQQTVQLDGARATLELVRVVARSSCGRASPESGDVFAVWDQALASLASSAITASTRGLTTTMLHVERTLDPNGRRIRTQQASMRTENVTQPWRSLPPDTLRRRGYVWIAADESATYNAPGLDALVSPRFLDDHCFRITAGRDTSEIGVAFEPVPERRRASDVAGTLWLHRGTAELRRLDFVYTNAPTATDMTVPAGGTLRFVRLRTGAVLISDWELRMPLLMKETARATRIRVDEIATTGGQLVTIRRGSDTLYKRPAVQLAGIVRDSVTSAIIADATVRLLGTPATARTDASGRFLLRDLLPGEYTLAVSTPSLDSIRASSGMSVIVADSTPLVTVRVPTAVQLAATLCGNALKGSAGSGKGAVLGMVRVTGDTAGLTNVSVSADWTEIAVAGGGVRPQSRRLTSRTDAGGAYRLCGVPTETRLTVRAFPAQGRADAAYVRLAPDERFATAPLAVDLARAAVATFVGTVVADSTGRALEGVEVAVPAFNLTTRTDARGQFRLSDVPVGTHEVTARRVGYQALTASLAFAANDEEDRRVVLRPLTVLDSVEVRATRIDNGMRVFEENRRIGLGHFLTRADLAKVELHRIGAIMATVPGTGIIAGRYLLSSRFTISPTAAAECDRPGNAGGVSYMYKPTLAEKRRGVLCRCYAQVYLDGVLMNPGQPTSPFDLNELQTVQLEGIEYYASPAQVPVQYARLNSPCGVLVLHSRRWESMDTTQARASR